MSSPQSSPINKSSVTDKDWYAIACKIRKQNQELKEKNTELEKLILEQKNQIKIQVINNQRHIQKIEELEVKNNHKNYLYEKQKVTTETINNELKKTQQLAAGLERECSLLQDNYNDIQHQLKQKEKENKELQTRLQRQQRYNIQLKTALDQYLNSSSINPSDVSSLGIESWSTDKSNNVASSWSIDESLERETINVNQENSEVILNNLNQTNDQKNVNEITEKINSFDLKNNEKSNVTSIRLDNNLTLPSVNKSEKIDNNLETKITDNSHNGKQRRKSFLKLPKFGK